MSGEEKRCVLYELSKKMVRKRKVIYIRKCDCVWLYGEESERKGK